MYKGLKIFFVTIVMLVMAACTSTNVLYGYEEDIVEVSNITEIFADNMTVSRGVVAKMLAIVHNDLGTIQSRDREIEFIDTNIEMWFDKYINTAYIDGLMEGFGDEFKPNEPITVGQAQAILDNLDPNNEINMEITEENINKPISYALWVDFYIRMLESLSEEETIEQKFGIIQRNVVILATPESNKNLPEYNIITNRGPMTSYGLNMGAYIDKEVMVLEKNNDIIAILDITTESPTIKGVYIVGSDESTITIFAGGVERTYNHKMKQEDLQGAVANIQISNNYVEQIFIYEEIVRDVVKRVTNDHIEFKNIGNYPINESMRVYSNYGNLPMFRNLNNIIIGHETADFYVKDGVIYAAVITYQATPETLRIALNTTGFGGVIHETVALSSNTEFTIQAGDKITTHQALEEVNIDESLFTQVGRIYIKPTEPDGKIIINSIKRNWENDQSPMYRGIIEVAKEENGFTIVNEICIEEYLFAVVPSEMPSSFGVEASMVQAVTARSYAYNQFHQNRFRAVGANMDDSVTSQVYNNLPENYVSIEAVNNTRGKVLTYEGRVISANFFSTSPGVSANSGEVWRDTVTNQFPTRTSTYLSSTKQFLGENYKDLSIEENMRAFLQDDTMQAYDSNFGWFRWYTEMTIDEISASVNKNLRDRYLANPSLIKTLQDDGVFRSRYVYTVGEVTDIRVTRRSRDAGNIMEMIIEGTENTILVRTEFNVRALIAPSQNIIEKNSIFLNKQDGTKLENYHIMPSAFYVMDKTLDEGGNITLVKFIGGGNGHGVGMSQNGVKGMIDKGYEFDDILKHFYSETEVVANLNR
jgi:stage II sporulation protein D